MRKQLDVATIANELRGQSAFFPRHTEPAAEPPQPAPPLSTSAPASAPHPIPPERAVPPVPLVRDVPPIRRIMKQRHPFDIYQDQYEALQELALEERKQGGVGSMSAMVREALDQLITTRKAAKK